MGKCASNRNQQKRALVSSLYRVSLCDTIRFVIVSFRHKGLQNLYNTGSHKGVQPSHVQKLSQILLILDAAQGPADLAYPFLRAHQLKGQLAGHWSVWVSGNWRVTFRFTSSGDVDYQDYH